MTFERTKDVELIKSIVTHPRVYPAISDDYSPSASAWEPPDPQLMWYVTAQHKGDLLGMWIFEPRNAICWQVHTCLLPRAYGMTARTAAVQMAEWIWGNTLCRRITTEVPEYNLLALRFALHAGMKQYGVNPAAFMKKGTLHDVILLGISKGDQPCP